MFYPSFSTFFKCRKSIAGVIFRLCECEWPRTFNQSRAICHRQAGGRGTSGARAIRGGDPKNRLGFIICDEFYLRQQRLDQTCAQKKYLIMFCIIFLT